MLLTLDDNAFEYVTDLFPEWPKLLWSQLEFPVTI